MLDPTKMDPKALMEMSQLIQELPPEQLSRMQTLMHNMMAGFDVRGEMEAFEKNLPPGFREKLMSVMGSQAGMSFAEPSSPPDEKKIRGLGDSDRPSQNDMDLHEARLTILRAVSEGQMTPEQAEKLLFKG